MPGVPNTVFYKAVILINGSAYAINPGGTRLQCPKNFQVPPIIGNFWQLNYGEGLRNPMVDCSMVVRNKSNEVMSPTFFNYFHTRTNDAAFDTLPLTSGITFWNGRSGFVLNNAKADSYTVGCASGDQIRISARFVGSTLTPITAIPAYATAFDRANILVFKYLTFLAGLSNVVWNFNLTFSNNHSPNVPLNGTEFPADQNAGMQTVGFNFMVQAATQNPLLLQNATSTNPFYTSSYGTVPDNAAFPPPSSPTTIAFQIAGSDYGASPTPFTRTFTLNNPIDNTPDDMDIPQGRVMRQHQYLCMGGDGQTTAPLTVS
jgi:hypothetical protein